MTATIKENLTWSSATQIITLLSGILGSVLISRCLGPEARGIYILALATSAFITAFMGGNAMLFAFTYTIGKKQNDVNKIAAQAFWFFIISVILTFAAWTLLPTSFLQERLPGMNDPLLWIILFHANSQNFYFYFQGILVGDNKIRLASTLSLLDVVFGLFSLVILLVVFKFGLQGAFWSLAGASAFKLILVLLFLKIKYQVFNFPDFQIMKLIAGYAVKHYPSHFAVMFVTNIDLTILALISGPTSVGIYSLARGLAQTIDNIEQPISRAINPAVVSGSLDRSGRIVAKTLRLTLLICFLAALLAVSLSPILIPVIYGQDFSGAVLPFMIMVFGSVFAATRMLLNFFSLQLGKPEYSTGINIGMVLISVPVFYFFTNAMGLIGTAAAMTLLYFIRSIISVLLFLHTTKLSLDNLIVCPNDIRQLMSRALFREIT